ncbi:hypothetical protein LT493_36220 [Streptomyces tricolor]|nr:hypothetical protein [Streptomyces tricolor]
MTDTAPAFTGARLLDETVTALSDRAPAILAAAADQLRGIRLGLHFNDGSHATLTARHSRLVVDRDRCPDPDVEVAFDNRAMNLLFDLQRAPVDQVLSDSLDVRGSRDDTLAVWRAFTLLSQRAAGLRSMRELWGAYREQAPQLWGQRDTRRPRTGRRPGRLDRAGLPRPALARGRARTARADR